MQHKDAYIWVWGMWVSASHLDYDSCHPFVSGLKKKLIATTWHHLLCSLKSFSSSLKTKLIIIIPKQHSHGRFSCKLEPLLEANSVKPPLFPPCVMHKAGAVNRSWEQWQRGGPEDEEEEEEEEWRGWGWWSEPSACHTYVKCKCVTDNPPESERLVSQQYLLAAEDSWREHRLLGADNLPPLLELGGQRLHLLLLLLLLSQQLLALLAGRHQPLLCRMQIEGEEFLAMEEPLHGELGQPQEFHQSRVHGALAPLASLPVQAAEGHRADVLLQCIHIQLAHHQFYVHGIDSPPVHALPPWTELERKEDGGSARWSHAWYRHRVLADRGIQERWDPCWWVGPLGVTGVWVVGSVVKWL